MNAINITTDLAISITFFPSNSRLIFDHLNNFVFVISFISNGILSFLIMTEKNKKIGTYSRVLLINMFFDIIQSIINFFIGMV